jgi:hypothetical protein
MEGGQAAVGEEPGAQDDQHHPEDKLCSSLFIHFAFSLVQDTDDLSGNLQADQTLWNAEPVDERGLRRRLCLI